MLCSKYTLCWSGGYPGLGPPAAGYPRYPPSAGWGAPLDLDGGGYPCWGEGYPRHGPLLGVPQVGPPARVPPPRPGWGVPLLGVRGTPGGAPLPGGTLGGASCQGTPPPRPGWGALWVPPISWMGYLPSAGSGTPPSRPGLGTPPSRPGPGTPPPPVNRQTN